MSLYVDLSEFFVNPIRTGIQRITGEMFRRMPRNAVIPVRLDSGRYVGFAPKLVDAIGAYFNDTGDSSVAEIRKLSDAANGRPIQLSNSDTVLVPEVFDNPQRVAFFREMPDQDLQRCRFIIYDLLPGTHPEYFHADRLVYVYAYYQLIRRATECGFISEHTREVYYGRLKRTNDRGGVVLPLGSDGLGPRVDKPILNRPPLFTVVGTIEPRKNHDLILEAFEPLLRQLDGLRLCFIGRMGWVGDTFARKVHSLMSDRNSGFEFHPAPDDGTIRRYIQQSRATIYVSAAEGYGLPPVESLWLGTPVIASTTIPSLERLGSTGIHYLEPLTVLNLRRAVLSFLDDAYASRKTQETARLNLPTWQSFTDEVLWWCTYGNGRL